MDENLSTQILSSKEKWKKISIAVGAFILVASISGGVAYYYQESTTKQARIEMQNKLDTISGENERLRNSQEKLQQEVTLCETITNEMRQSVGNPGALDDMNDARGKSKKAEIKSTMSSAFVSGTICKDSGKTILSGSGGEKVCENQDFKWPKLNCGENDSDTKWVVKNGNGENWDFVLECKEFSDCNGPQNAICNSEGCKFTGTCQ
jgi:hypothetical protein